MQHNGVILSGLLLGKIHKNLQERAEEFKKEGSEKHPVTSDSEGETGAPCFYIIINQSFNITPLLKVSVF